MKDRLYIAGQILAGMTTSEDDLTKPHLSSYALAAADALIAAHEATAKPVEAENNGKPPLWKRLVELGEQVPDAEWANVPTDLSVTLRRYLYGGEQALPAPLPEDAPVMEWEVRVVGSGGGYVARARPTESNETMKAWHLMHDAAGADLPALRAAATAYSAAKGCRAVFVGYNGEKKA